MMKFAARVFLPFVVVWLCVMPGRAYAIGPALGLVAVAEGGGTAAVSTAAASAWGTLLGLSLAGMSIVDGAATRARLPTTSDPALAFPAPDAPATSTQTPGSTVYKWIVGFHLEAARDTKLEACNVYSGSYNENLSRCYITQANCVAAGYSNCTGPVDAVIGSVPVTEPPTCPAGYVVDGSSCLLSNPRAVEPDNNCDYSRSGADFVSLSDVDCGGGGVVCVGDKCTAVGVSADGDPLSFIITGRPDGGSTITVLEGGLIGNTTVTDSVVVGVSPGGIVESVTGATNTGSLPAEGALPSGPVVNPAPVTINFPSDYARTGEAQTAANTLAPKLDTIHSDLSVTQTVADPLTLGASDMPDWGTTFGALNSWTVPAHSSACPAPSVDLSGVFGVGSVYAFDAHCQLVADHYNALQAAMMVVWSLLALFVVLRA